MSNPTTQSSYVVTQVPAGSLTSLEKSLVKYVRQGEALDLAVRDEAVGEAEMRSWGKSRACRASVIRDILRKQLVADPDPHVVRLRGAKITGLLDLKTSPAMSTLSCKIAFWRKASSPEAPIWLSSA
jgi:hypothetical protein